MEKSKMIQLLDGKYNLKPNVVKMSCANTMNHELAKAKLMYMLMKEGNQVYSEAIFTNNQGRADLYIPSRLEVYEVLESETLKKFENKKSKYPKEVTIFGIRAKDILKKDFAL